MRQQALASSAGPGRGFTRLRFLAAALALGLAFPAFSSAVGGPTNGVGFDRGGDDETIGTLPITGNHGQHLPLVRKARDTRPAFYLEGSYGDLVSTIAGFTGSGSVSLQA